MWFDNDKSENLTRVMSAAEIFTTAYCNMNCKYCYIPKTDGLKDVHKKIIEAIKDDSYITLLKRIYDGGEGLTSLSFWGTEPTLTLNELTKKIGKLCDEFPNLTKFDMSTNLLSNHNTIIEFIEELEIQAERTKHQRQNKERNPKDEFIEFSFQVSLDGPEEITDYNRHPNSTKAIVSHLLEIYEVLYKKRFKHIRVKSNLKSTLSFENIKEMVEDPAKLESYADFFETLLENLKRIGMTYDPKRESGFGHQGSITPTHVVPGNYTSSDGKVLAKFYRQLDSLGRSGRYQHLNSLGQFGSAVEDLIEKSYLVESRPYQITCSGGDCNFSVDFQESLHICHRMLFLNNEEYVKGITSEQQRSANWDVDLIEKSTIGVIKKYYTPNVNNREDFLRFLYLNRSYHDFLKTRQEFAYTMIKELAFAGQASPIYLLDDNMAHMFSYFMAMTFTCPAESLICNGHLNTIPTSLLRAFGNGLFEETMERYLKGKKRREDLYTGRVCRSEC